MLIIQIHPNTHIYSRYHTTIDVYTTALLLKKPSSDDDSGFRHGFGAEALLPLAQSAPAVSYDTTRLCQIVVALWDCQNHADAVRALPWIFSMYSLLSDGGSPRLVKKIEVELEIKPLHPTSIGNTFVIQPLFSQIFIFFQITIYIYIYIYIYCHSQTDSFFVPQLFTVARHVGGFKLGLKSGQRYGRLTILPHSQQSTYVSSRIFRHYVVTFVCLHFALLDIRVLNSYSALCIT